MKNTLKHNLLYGITVHSAILEEYSRLETYFSEFKTNHLNTGTTGLPNDVNLDGFINRVTELQIFDSAYRRLINDERCKLYTFNNHYLDELVECYKKKDYDTADNNRKLLTSFEEDLFKYILGLEKKDLEVLQFRDGLTRDAITLNVIDLTNSKPKKIIRNFIKSGYLYFNLFETPNNCDYSYVKSLESKYSLVTIKDVYDDRNHSSALTNFNLDESHDWLTYNQCAKFSRFLFIVNEDLSELDDLSKWTHNRKFSVYYTKTGKLKSNDSSMLNVVNKLHSFN